MRIPKRLQDKINKEIQASKDAYTQSMEAESFDSAHIFKGWEEALEWVLNAIDKHEPDPNNMDQFDDMLTPTQINKLKKLVDGVAYKAYLASGLKSISGSYYTFELCDVEYDEDLDTNIAKFQLTVGMEEPDERSCDSWFIYVDVNKMELISFDDD